MKVIDQIADLPRVAKCCALLFVAFISCLIALSAIKYFPAQFEFGFLVGRESYFYSWYAVAFYVHVVSSPVAIGIGTLQSISWLRRRRIAWHRRLGNVYVLLVLLLATPSGLAMAFRANEAGAVMAFATLAVATFGSTWAGYRAAVAGRIREHGQWMTRSYLLMCSAVLLRFFAAIVNAFELYWISYSALAWLSWLPSLLIYEIGRRVLKRRP